MALLRRSSQSVSAPMMWVIISVFGYTKVMWGGTRCAAAAAARHSPGIWEQMDDSPPA